MLLTREVYDHVFFFDPPGKVKPVTLRGANDESFEPTPMFDCHVSQARPTSSDKFVQVINKTLIYIYEFDDDCLPVQRPRQNLPFAVLNFVLKPSSTLASQLSLAAPSPLAPPQQPPPPHASLVYPQLPPPLPPPLAPPFAAAAKGSPQQLPSSSPNAAPLSSPDRSTPLDPRRMGAQSMPKRGILRGHAFHTQSFSSPGYVQVSWRLALSGSRKKL